MRGFLWIMAFSNISISLLGLRRLVRTTECPIALKKSLFLPILATACAILISRFFHVIWVSGAVFMSVYTFVLALGGALKKEELLG
jgi:hypothetical protein